MAANREPSGAEKMFGDFAPALVEFTDEVLFGQVWERREHGAAPGHFMTHLARWENPGPDGGPENTWLEHVTDAEYSGPRVSTRR